MSKFKLVFTYMTERIVKSFTTRVNFNLFNILKGFYFID